MVTKETEAASRLAAPFLYTSVERYVEEIWLIFFPPLWFSRRWERGGGGRGELLVKLDHVTEVSAGLRLR